MARARAVAARARAVAARARAVAASKGRDRVDGQACLGVEATATGCARVVGDEIAAKEVGDEIALAARAAKQRQDGSWARSGDRGSGGRGFRLGSPVYGV